MDAQGPGIVFWLVYAAVIVLMIASLWKVYVKAGKPGWAAIVPIYNYIVLLEIVKKPLWWIILLFIPFVNFIVAILVYNELSKAFGKGTGFAVGLIFLPFIFIPLLGFGDAEYVYGDGASTTSVEGVVDA